LVLLLSQSYFRQISSLEFNSSLFLYFCSFTSNFGSVSSANNQPVFLAVHSTGCGPTTKAVYEKLALERHWSQQLQKNGRKMSRSTSPPRSLGYGLSRSSAARKEDTELQIWMEKAERSRGILHFHMR